MFYRNILVIAALLANTLSSGAYAQYGDTTTTSTSTAASTATGTGFSAQYNNTVLRHPLLGNIGTIYAEVRSGKTYVRVYGENNATVFTGMTVLNGANQIPTVPSNGVGTGVFVLDTVNNTLSYNITFSGLTSNETGAHIHGPVDSMTNTGILFPLASGSPKIGVWNYSQDQENDILAGNMYVNIHSTNYPNGEIRGQIYVPYRFTLDTTSTPSILNGIADKLGMDATTIQPFVLFRFVDIVGASDMGTSPKEMLRSRLESLRQSYLGIFNSIGQRIDNINENRKTQVLMKLIDQIDMKVAQIKQSSRQLSNKQDLILLYGNLRLMIQEKLIGVGSMAQTVETEDDILNDAATTQ